MKTSTRFILAVAMGLGIATAQVQLPFSRHVANSKRDAKLSLVSAEYIYVINATVGTPGQVVSLVLSPSSPHTWVPDADTLACRGADYYGSELYSEYYDEETYGDYYTPEEIAEMNAEIAEMNEEMRQKYQDYYQCYWGSYNKTASSTYMSANQRYDEFDESTADGGSSEGVNVTDTLTLGDMSFENYPLGVVSSTLSWIGTLGLGPNLTTLRDIWYYSYYSSSSSAGNYPTLLDQMVAQDKIKTQAYSIWLDDPEGTTGSVLFGAIDTSKYEGELTRMAAYSSDMRSYVYSGTFGVEVHSINATADESTEAQPITTNDTPFYATIGTGETLSILPHTLATRIWGIAGAYYNKTAYQALIACNAADTNDARLAIRLGGEDGPVLDVQLSDLIMSAAVRDNDNYYYASDSLPEGTCLFGVQNGSISDSRYGYYSGYSSSSYDQYYNIGSTLLRRAYLVFDAVNFEVAVAPMKFDSTLDSDVVAFEGHGATIPQSKAYCGSDSSTCASTSSTGSGSGSSGSRSSSSSGDDGSNSMLGVIIGVTVGVGCMILIGVLLGVWACRRSRMRQQQQQDMAAKQTGFDSDGPPPMSGAVALPQQPAPVAPAPLAGNGNAPVPAANLRSIEEEAPLQTIPPRPSSPPPQLPPLASATEAEGISPVSPPTKQHSAVRDANDGPGAPAVAETETPSAAKVDKGKGVEGSS